jgi:hypothetical protein
MREVTGNCLCKKTAFTIIRLGNEVTACHCSMCRKQAAGPVMYTEAVPWNNVKGIDEETVTIYPSSKWAERGFCKHCGTFLFYRYQKGNEAHFNVELFEELVDKAVFTEEIFYADKPAYYDFGNETNKEA